MSHLVRLIRVNGLPAPQGSKTHVGGGRMIESSRAVGPWREAIRNETQRDVEFNPGYIGVGDPVEVSVVFWLPRPRGHYGTGGRAGQLKTSSPDRPTAKKDDVDKLSRAALDGIVAGGALPDDSQIVDLHAHKRYASESFPPGCEIRISLV